MKFMNNEYMKPSHSEKSEETIGKVLKGFWYNALDIALNVIVIVAVVTVIRTFIVSPFQVEGSSMVPTLEDNEYIIINKIGYIVGKPDRGDVIVFRPPNETGKYYVKRVIGLPGEEVVIKDGNVYIVRDNEEVRLNESYLNDRNQGHTFNTHVSDGNEEAMTYQVPYDSYFLLGDNRQGSLDSRSFHDDEGKLTPYVNKDRITGKVWVVALPVKKSHALNDPEYSLE